MAIMRDSLIALLVLGGIMTGAMLYGSSLASNVGASAPIANNTALQSIGRIENASKDLYESVKGSQITGTFLDVPLTIISSVYNVLKLLLTTLTEIFNVVVGGVASALFAPGWVSALIMAVIGIMLVFAIVAAALRWDI